MTITMEGDYREIEKEQLAKARVSAWSIENMEAHLAEAGKTATATRYIGSTETEVGDIYDYYKDEGGAYWYGRRYRMPDGTIVPMEVKIFGREYKAKKQRRTLIC